jgi:hypothetical protein
MKFVKSEYLSEAYRYQALKLGNAPPTALTGKPHSSLFSIRTTPRCGFMLLSWNTQAQGSKITIKNSQTAVTRHGCVARSAEVFSNGQKIRCELVILKRSSYDNCIGIVNAAQGLDSPLDTNFRIPAYWLQRGDHIVIKLDMKTKTVVYLRNGDFLAEHTKIPWNSVFIGVDMNGEVAFVNETKPTAPSSE